MVVTDRLRDVVRVPDPHALVVILEVKESERDTVGECVEKTELDMEPLTVPLKEGVLVWVVEMLTVLQTVVVTLPVRETENVGLTEAEVQPETVLVEKELGVFVTVKVPVWHTLSEGVGVTDRLRDVVRVPDPHALVVILGVEQCEPDAVEE